MKLIVIAIMVISVLLAAGCTVPQPPTNQPTETITPPVLEVETSTAPAAESAQVYQVAIENGELMPVDVEINAGDTVEWVNKDAVRYTLLFSGFEERLPVGGTFEQVFTESRITSYSANVVEEDQEDDQQQELQGTIVVN